MRIIYHVSGRFEITSPRARRASYCVALLLVAGVAEGRIALAQQPGPRFLWGEGTARYYTFPGSFARTSAAAPSASATIPLWTGSFRVNGNTYAYTMVGTDPAMGSQTTIVPVVIIPLKFVFADGTVLDAAGPVFNSPQSAVQKTLQSPIFQTASFAPGGTDVGTTQYPDAFQRANFWNAVSTSAPNYHVLLKPSILPMAIPVNVPAAYGKTVTGPGSRIGYLNLNYFNVWLSVTLPKLTFLRPNELVLFLTYSTFFTESGVCCVLGFHSATGISPATAQTLAVAAYSDPGVFSQPIEDIHALSHEVGEWMNDPLGNNPAPGWLAGQATTCQTNVEVGDPVTGIAFNVSMNGMTYHPEDLVFLSWFARQNPSTAVNGWYTFLNSFNSPPAICR